MIKRPTLLSLMTPSYRTSPAIKAAPIRPILLSIWPAAFVLAAAVELVLEVNVTEDVVGVTVVCAVEPDVLLPVLTGTPTRAQIFIDTSAVSIRFGRARVSYYPHFLVVNTERGWGLTLELVGVAHLDQTRGRSGSDSS
jgi:hypothetical protein